MGDELSPWERRVVEWNTWLFAPERMRLRFWIWFLSTLVLVAVMLAVVGH